MSQLSKEFFLVDWTNTYIMQLLLLYVPYRWYGYNDLGAKILQSSSMGPAKIKAVLEVLTLSL